MARKSNKTSHVLHLLAGEEPVPEAEKGEKDEPESTAQPQKTAPEPEPESPEISIITAGSSGDDPLSDLIKDELEKETVEPPRDMETPVNREPIPDLQEETTEEEFTAEIPESETSLSKDPETHAPEPVTSAAETPEPETLEPEEPESPEPETLAAEALEPEISKAEIKDNSEGKNETDHSGENEDKSSPPSEQVESAEHLNALLYPDNSKDSDTVHYRFINVMEYVVTDMVVDYMKKFGMCTCERCVVDTTALALTLCSAKYIVVDKNTVSPLLNYYANKYTGDVTVALTRACTMVNENPRH